MVILDALHSDRPPRIRLLATGRRTNKNAPKNYHRARLLFKGNHHDVFERIQRWLEKEQDKAITYVVCNFAGLLSRFQLTCSLARFPASWPARAKRTVRSRWINDIVNDNHLPTLNYEMALSSSWRGETIYKVRYGKFGDWAETEHAIIEAASPGIFWPILDEDNVRGLRGGVFGWIKQAPGNSDKKYLRIERQLPGRIKNELYLLDGRSIKEQVNLNIFPEYAELPEEQETRYPGLLFEFVPNWRLDDEFWGMSDYYDLEGIFDELNNRVSRISRVLDKHESPKLILPPGIMKWDEQYGRWYIEKEDLEAIEVDPQRRRNSGTCRAI